MSRTPPPSVARGTGSLAAVALVSALLLAPVPGRATPADPVSSPRSSIRWQPCAGTPAFDCAEVAVPLDYDRPQGRKITLAVVRHRATRDRIGSLFFNPGGPGGPGVAALQQFLNRFPRPLQERFDLVSWDPRGVGESTAVQCFPDQAAEARFLARVPATPIGPEQVRRYAANRRTFAKRCAARNGALLRHVSTADSARDMDLLRQAVGDRHLNYWGISYGTMLGATYANLFPGRMRAITLDGNVRPTAWVQRNRTGPFLPTFLRQRSERGAAVTMNAFLRLCARAGAAECPFADADAEATVAKFDALVRSMRRHPLQERGGVTYSVLLDQTANGLYLVDVWPRLAQFLQNVWTDTPPPASQSLADQRYAGLEQATAILCGESPNPTVGSLPALIKRTSRESGALAPYWVWVAGACAAWRARAADPYRGPWDERTRRPILLVGTTHDPATPLESSRVMARELDRTRLLVVHGYGHTAFLNPSACTDRLISRYFISGRLPATGARCRQGEPQFSERALD